MQRSALTLSLVATASGFAPAAIGHSAAAAPGVRSSAAPLMGLDISPEVSRRALLAGMLGAGIGIGASPVQAGYVTSLGIVETKPSDAELDEDLLKTREVQAGIENLKGYKRAAAALEGQFAKNKDVPLIPTIRKYFDFSKLRDDLNVVTAVFDEGTQPTIDRLSRAILYDLTELENASRFKKGEEQVRTPKKVDNVEKWFKKLDTDFGSLIQYFS